MTAHDRPQPSGRIARVAARIAIATTGIALATMIAGPATASEPVDLDGAYVLDTTGALGDDTARVEQALDDLFDATGAGLYVVVTDRFEGTADGFAWAERSALLSGLGERDTLLAIAVTERSYAFSYGPEWAISTDRADEAEVEELVPALRDDRFAEAIVAYAAALESGASGDGGAGGGDADTGGVPLVPLLGGLAAIALLVWIVLRALRRSRSEVERRTDGDGTTAPPQPTLAELDRATARRLVELDDALTTSEQELGFAEAQFGTATVAGFRTALESARQKVGEAFRLRRSLDDSEPEDEAVRRETLGRIGALLEDADDLLEEQEEAFDQLRDVEQELPAAIAALRTAERALAERVDGARAAVERLAAAYAPDAIAPIRDVPEQGERLLALLRDELAEAESKSAAGSTGEAAVDVRAAQLASTQLSSSIDAVDRLAAELATAREHLAEQRADLRAGIASAQTMPTDPAVAGAAAAANAALATSESGERDPIGALRALVEADRRLDEALATAREAGERSQAAAAALDRTLAAARSRIHSTAQFIAAHRGGVGATARSTLAEAQATLDAAVQAPPEQAVHAANRAAQLAAHALQQAEADVSSTMGGGSPFGLPGMPGGILGGGRGGGVGDAIIGGLIGGLLSGGGSRGGFGGFSGGGLGGFGGGPTFGSSRRSGGGSFGGVGGGFRSSGRRSGGGRF